MFDIKSYSLESGVYTFKGLFDEEETVLRKQIDKTSRKSGNEHFIFSQFFKLMQFSQSNSLSVLLLTFHPIKKTILNQYRFNLPSPLQDVITPPPDQLFM